MNPSNQFWFQYPQPVVEDRLHALAPPNFDLSIPDTNPQQVPYMFDHFGFPTPTISSEMNSVLPVQFPTVSTALNSDFLTGFPTPASLGFSLPQQMYGLPNSFNAPAPISETSSSPNIPSSSALPPSHLPFNIENLLKPTFKTPTLPGPGNCKRGQRAPLYCPFCGRREAKKLMQNVPICETCRQFYYHSRNNKEYLKFKCLNIPEICSNLRIGYVSCRFCRWNKMMSMGFLKTRLHQKPIDWRKNY